MSFSSNVKEELLAKCPENTCCKQAECSAIVAFCAKTSKNLEKTEDFSAVSDSALALKCFTLTKKSFNISKVCEDAPTVLKKTCCIRSYLRGVFLACGSVSDPRKSYHLEFHVEDLEKAELIKSLLKNFDVEAKLAERQNGYGVYIKGGDSIVQLLAVMDAPKALMEMENSRIMKEVRNSVNRRVNCETANIGKTVAASTAQIDDIKRLKLEGHYASLPKSLREIAELRIAYPEATLEELGKRLDPPIGKSGVNHRLRRLAEIAEKTNQAYDRTD